MITLGFKTNDIIISDAIEDLKRIDEKNVFAEPVDLLVYKEKIKNPICLRDITEKSNAKQYEDVAEARSSSSQNRRRRRQHQSPMTVEDVTNTVQEDVKSEEVMTTTKKLSRKRGIQETLLSDSDDVDPSKPSTSGIIPVEFAVRESRLKARNIEEIVPTRTIFGTLRKRVSLFENAPKNLKKPLESPLTQKQTKLTNFFVTTPKVTFFDRIQRKNIDGERFSL
ncbi:hypothetical protein CRE_06275 [Caenorhabditis remanei]|uniref:Uncharacterized protein n=1 Tax=Caenorhabditis remanei TaxID=31234 RepID=E3NW69_CAERE|nr:hypothetical protein CRE_06275 [Caenorhabditis remanei]